MGEESGYCYSDDPHPYLYLATKTSYFNARNTHLDHDTLVPEGQSLSSVYTIKSKFNIHVFIHPAQ